jgi:anion-transporting  ArsA/GET3 family ATPase
MAPTRASFKVANLALVTFFRTVAKVIGSEVVDDLVAFFQAFEGMEDGFRRRARKVTELLADPRTAFVLITSPGRDAISEAGYFSRRLREAGLGVDGLVVNRIHPRFGDETPEDLRARALALAGAAASGELADGPAGLARLYENLADFSELAGLERRHLVGLEQHVGEVPIVRVPLLPTEVCDFSGLLAVGRHLLAPVPETDLSGGSG